MSNVFDESINTLKQIFHYLLPWLIGVELNSLNNVFWSQTDIHIRYWFLKKYCISCIILLKDLAVVDIAVTVTYNGPLARYVKLRVRMRRECRERFPRHRRWAIPTCITARASRTCRDACRDRQLAVSFEIGGGGKRSRHSRRMRNLQFYVSGKRPIIKHIGIPDLYNAITLTIFIRSVKIHSKNNMLHIEVKRLTII